MTIRQTIQEYLPQVGIFDDDIIAAIIDTIINNEEYKPMKILWDADVNGYPPITINMILVNVCSDALMWLKKHKPKHYVIPLLESKVCNTPLQEVKDE